MLDTIQNLSITTFMVIIGPILLGLGIAYGIVLSRRRTRAAKAHTEAATRSLYRQAGKEERRTAP
jgi:predicted RND superfamily exporter protein